MPQLIAKAVSLTTVLAGIALCHTVALGQNFSSDLDYTAFYDDRFDSDIELQTEPTIALWWIIEKFGDKNTELETLSRLLDRHAKLYPDCEYAQRVKSHLDAVNRMLKEKRPTDDQKVLQLIYDLRNLNMHQYKQPNRGLKIIGPGSLRVRGKEYKPDAAEQLVSIGSDAIPLLIDHIDDKTLTRSVDYWRDNVFSHRVLTVGECCVQIIENILPSDVRFDIAADPVGAKQRMKEHYQQLIAKEQRSE